MLDVFGCFVFFEHFLSIFRASFFEQFLSSIFHESCLSMFCGVEWVYIYAFYLDNVIAHLFVWRRLFSDFGGVCQAVHAHRYGRFRIQWLIDMRKCSTVSNSRCLKKDSSLRQASQQSIQNLAQKAC